MKPSLTMLRSSTPTAATPDSPKPIISPLVGCKFKALGEGEGRRQRRSWSMGPTGQAGGGWIAQTQHFHAKQGKARRLNATESFLQGRETKGGEEEAEKQQQFQ